MYVGNVIWYRSSIYRSICRRRNDIVLVYSIICLSHPSFGIPRFSLRRCVTTSNGNFLGQTSLSVLLSAFPHISVRGRARGRVRKRQQSYFLSENYQAHAISLRILFSNVKQHEAVSGVSVKMTMAKAHLYRGKRERKRKGETKKAFEKDNVCRKRKREREREGGINLRWMQRGCIIVVVVRAILSRLAAVNQCSHDGAVTFSQLVSQSVNPPVSSTS